MRQGDTMSYSAVPCRVVPCHATPRRAIPCRAVLLAGNPPAARTGELGHERHGPWPHMRHVHAGVPQRQAEWLRRTGIRFDSTLTPFTYARARNHVHMKKVFLQETQSYFMP